MTTLQRTGSNCVWYASYGSNLNKKRFMCYITGGSPSGSNVVNPGCRDKTPPQADKPVSLDWELFFAGYSSWWKGAAAFIRRSSGGKTALGRMYLITDEQFNDVVLQENARRVNGRRLVPSYEELCQQEEFTLPGIQTYGRLVRTGEESGFPILTFTSSKEHPKIGTPSGAYLKTIARGIKETYPSVNDSEICTYFQSADGIRDRIPKEQLKRWIAETR